MANPLTVAYGDPQNGSSADAPLLIYELAGVGAFGRGKEGIFGQPRFPVTRKILLMADINGGFVSGTFFSAHTMSDMLFLNFEYM